MAPIATYVFFDFGTTGKDPKVDEITELAMVAVNRQHLLETSKSPSQKKLRVQNKLIRCFNVKKNITYTAKKNGRGGFKKEDLHQECYFDESCFPMIDNFLDTLKKPVCLVAHNGARFDLPILKRYSKTLGLKFSDDNLMCADSMMAFYDIESKPVYYMAAGTSDEGLNGPPRKKRMLSVRRLHAKHRNYPWPSKPEESYELEHVYKRVLKKAPRRSHQGEVDCELMLKIAIHLGRKFIAWIDNDEYNLLRFPADIKDL